MKNNKSSPKPPIPNIKKTQKPPQKTSNPALKFGKQLLVAVVGLFLLLQAKKSVDGYRWVYDDLLKGNMETILKYPNLSVQERYQMKMGFPISYMDYIKQNTPDSAIILFPARPVFADTKDPKQDMSGMFDWCSYKYGYLRFLYPRKVVFEPEKGESPYFEKITHVAVINGWGYDYLSYPVPPEYRLNNTVLPINSTNSNPQ